MESIQWNLEFYSGRFSILGHFDSLVVNFETVFSLDDDEQGKWSSVVLSYNDQSKHIVLCFHHQTCLRLGRPIYDDKDCEAILDYVKISEFKKPCDDDHFLGFITNEIEQNQLFEFIYDRKNSMNAFEKSLMLFIIFNAKGGHRSKF